MSYTVSTFNGNTGSDSTFDTYEIAKAYADFKWSRLTPEEKKRTTDWEGRRAFFYISENDEQDVEIRTVYDYADVMEE